MVKVLLSDGREIPALRKILANKSIRVFVKSPLPGGIGMSKIESGGEGLGDSFVLGKFFAVVSREGVDALRQRRKQFQDGLGDTLCFLRGHFRNQG